MTFFTLSLSCSGRQDYMMKSVFFKIMARIYYLEQIIFGATLLGYYLITGEYSMTEKL